MKIAIIGQGNVAWHLSRGLAVSNEVHEVNSRTLSGLPIDADLYLISVSDDAIVSVAERLPKVSGVVAHTSGSVPITVLRPFVSHPGVWYPLQTFTKGADLDYRKIPVFIEAEDADSLSLLRTVAEGFTDRVYEADSDIRRRLHVASVFACNYVNHLWKIADDILKADGLTLDIMIPLIEATAEKVQRLSPIEAQTGPASRGDLKIVEAHLQWLDSNHPDLSPLYRTLAERIIKSEK